MWARTNNSTASAAPAATAAARPSAMLMAITVNATPQFSSSRRRWVAS